MVRDKARDLPLARFVAEGAIELAIVGKRVSDVRFVLLPVEEHIEVIPRRKIPLRRALGQSLRAVVADVAGLERTRCELNDMTFDARTMSGELEAQPLVARRSRYYSRKVRSALMTIIALELACSLCPGNLDHTQMRTVRKTSVLLWG
jgi:hypothetical protein